MSKKADVPDYAKSIPPKLEPQYGYSPFKESRFAALVHRYRGDKQVWDFWRSGITNRMRVERKWVKANESQLYRAGYNQAIALLGDWEYMGMKTYARLHNFKVCDAKL